MYYFDNAASSKVLENSAKAALEVMTKYFANPSSLHSFGLKSEKILNSCRRTIAEILSRDETEIIFTSGATESINLAILGTAKKNKQKKTIITSSVEHTSTNQCLKFLEDQNYNIIKINPVNHNFSSESFVDAITTDCFLVSVMHVNNENGLILPVEDIAKKVKNKDKNIVVHVDAAQSFMKLPIDLTNIDLLSVSGHKIGAPAGIGSLFVKKQVKISPIFFGAEQENNLRPGTQATPLVKAFEAAISYISQNKESFLKHYNSLKQTLISKVQNIKNIHFNFNENSVPYIVNLSLVNIKSQIVLQYLEEKGFIVSSGAAFLEINKIKPY